MAIKGLTDQAAALPIIGQLRKGDEKTGNRPGKDLQYFRFTSGDPEVVNLFYKHHSQEPQSINVMLPFRTTDENMDAWIEKWVAGGLEYRSDGETVVLWQTPEGHYSTEEKDDPKPTIGKDGKRADGSGQVGRLSVVIPEMGRFATVTVLTTSKHDIMNLTKQLRSYEGLRGDLRGIPFVLTRKPVKISTPNGDKRARREKWMLSIETQPAWTMRQISAMQQAALPAVVEDDVVEEAEYEVVNQLPDGIDSPFDEGTKEEPPPEPVEAQAKQERKVLDPETLKGFLHQRAGESALRDKETGEGFPIKMHSFGEKTANLVAAKLRDAVKLSGDPQADYKAALNWLFGVESAHDLNAPQADALLDWLLNGGKDQGFDAPVIDPAPREAKAIVALAKAQREPAEVVTGEETLEEYFGEQPTLMEMEEPVSTGAAYAE